MGAPIELTEDQYQAFQHGMLAFAKARVEEKERSEAMAAAGLFLGKRFREEFTTTIPDPAALLSVEALANTAVGAIGVSVPAPESVIYMPRKHRALRPTRRASLLTHETHHAWLNQQGWPKEPYFYAVNTESRTEDEVQCMTAAASVQRRLEGTLPDRVALVATLTDAYHLKPEDGPLAGELLTTAWWSFTDGGVLVPSTPVAMEAHRLLDSLGVGWA